MNPFSAVSVMSDSDVGRPARNRRRTAFGQELDASSQARIQREEARQQAASAAAADAAATLQQEYEAVEALLSISATRVTPEMLRNVTEMNEQYIRELSEFREVYELDLNDERRKQLMENFEIRTLDNFATALYGEMGVAAIRERYGVKSAVRKFFENYGGDQCDAIKARNPLVSGRTKCWICGFPILDKVPDTASKKSPVINRKVSPKNSAIPKASVHRGPASGFSNECEHVFPIAQAVFFIDLYRGVDTPRDTIDLVQLEYDWSHRVCNQIKNDTHFVSIDPSRSAERRWVVSPDKAIVDFLVDLYQRSGMYFKRPTDSENLLKRAIDGYGSQKWITERLGVIKKRVNAVLDAESSRCYPGLFIVAQVGKCLEMFQRQIVDTRGDVEMAGRGRKTRHKRRGGTRRRKRKN